MSRPRPIHEILPLVLRPIHQAAKQAAMSELSSESGGIEGSAATETEHGRLRPRAAPSEASPQRCELNAAYQRHLRLYRHHTPLEDDAQEAASDAE